MPNFLQKKTKNPKASVLAAALIIMSAMLVIAMSVVTVSVQERKSSIGSSKSSLAYQNAESGIEDVMQKIKDHLSDINLNNIDTDGTCNGVFILPGPLKYKVELKNSTGTVISNCATPVSSIARIKSTGYSNQDNRAIEVTITP
jgi:Tfp pilus assembly protein PilX